MTVLKNGSMQEVSISTGPPEAEADFDREIKLP